jgi:hypothetical protein
VGRSGYAVEALAALIVLIYANSLYGPFCIYRSIVNTDSGLSKKGTDLFFYTTINTLKRNRKINLSPFCAVARLIFHDNGRGQVLSGQMVNLLGNAIANFSLTWSHVQDGVCSTSRRTTAAGAQGDLRFTPLGPGPHTIAMNVPGYKPARLTLGWYGHKIWVWPPIL